jgi:hypothetical protein
MAGTDFPRKPRMRGWRVALLPVLLLAPALALALPRDGTVAVIGRPGASVDAMARLVAQAGGAIVRLGPSDNIIVATSAETGFVTRLYGAGALLVLDALVADACFPSSTSRDKS